jgi:hypothetical protein
MRVFARVGIALAIFAGSVTLPAAADPLRITYRIDVFKQCEYADSTGEVCRAYSSSFPLIVTFDPGVTYSFDSAVDHQRAYGTPTVSHIPLPRRTDFPPMTISSATTSERAQFGVETDWRRDASVLLRQYGSQDGSDYHRDFSLIANGVSAGIPDLSAASFAAFLGTAPFRQFGLSDAVELASGGFEALSYYGNISLEPNTAPTPEPASLLLLGTGLGAIGWRRRRRSRY